MRTSFILDSVLTGIRRNLTMTIALILSTSIALAFVSASLLASREIGQFKKDYEGTLNVSVVLCTTNNAGVGGCVARPVLGADGKQKVVDGVKQTDASTTTAQQSAIDKMLSADPTVSSHTFVSQKEQFRRAQKTLTSEERKILAEGDLAASFTVKLKDIKKDYAGFVKRYSTVAGVSQTSNSNKVINTLLDIIDGIRLFSLVIAIVVLVASILLIANTIQVAAAQRRNETSIMRLVGASRWMTEMPFLLETTVATVIGALVAFGMTWIGKAFVLDNIFQLQVQNGVIPNLGANDLLIASGEGLIGGVLVSALTAFLTLRLYVKL